jgi:NADH:ubiquinone oxidoreductase subunit 3 (subunit A)
VLGEFSVAFVLVFAASLLVYMSGNRLAPKSIQTENGRSTYTCGEKATPQKLIINVSLYKYLIYFVIIDSSVLLLAFASPGLYAANLLLLMIYLLIIATSGLILMKGRDH